ncbi:Protein CBG24023 [Caenorhabditis briggsae]|uniref:Protein CBG24023 n=1 Tax=Caenorhabditis briggsae TaxID=6238 RepID=A8WJT7_CAEBR|nr:Protein CBG24023 [Caenorhabditis briggsae]CAP20730.1 Protein CBG24023 [Caenorhabditis briggsae]
MPRNHCFQEHKLQNGQSSQDTITAQLDEMINNFKTWGEENVKKSKLDGKPLPKVLILYDDVSKFLKNKMKGFGDISRHFNMWNMFLVHRTTYLDADTRGSCRVWIFLSEVDKNIDPFVSKYVDNNNFDECVLIYDTTAHGSKNEQISYLRKSDIKLNYNSDIVLNKTSGIDKEIAANFFCNPEAIDTTGFSEEDFARWKVFLAHFKALNLKIKLKDLLQRPDEKSSIPIERKTLVEREKPFDSRMNFIRPNVKFSIPEEEASTSSEEKIYADSPSECESETDSRSSVESISEILSRIYN